MEEKKLTEKLASAQGSSSCVKINVPMGKKFNKCKEKITLRF